MRKLALIFLVAILPSVGWAAFVEHYVTSGGSGLYANATASATPTSMTSAVAHAAAGDRIWCKAGSGSNYTPGGTMTHGASGTVGQPIVFEGYLSTTGTLGGDGYLGRTNGQALITTNYPIINMAGNLYTQGKDYIVIRNLSITGARSGSTVSSTGNYSTWENCVIQSTQNNASAVAITCSTGNLTELVNCDLTGTGATQLYVASLTGAGCRADSCRISWTGATALTALLNLGSTRHIAFGNTLFCTVAAVGMDCTNTDVWIKNNTFNNCSVAIRTANATKTERLTVRGNIFYTSTAENVQNQNSGSANQPIQLTRNIQYNAAGANIGLNDWNNDYLGYTTDPAFVTNGSDFRIKSTSAGVGVGVPAYMDLGSNQRQENYPTTSNVVSGVTYSVNGESVGAEPTPTPCPTATPCPAATVIISED